MTEPQMDPRLIEQPAANVTSPVTPTDPKPDHLLSNKIYDVLHLLAMIVFPALGTLYFALSGIWGLPAAEKVIGTITAIDAFLGVLLSISKSSYDSSDAKYDGDINVNTDSSGKKVFTLALDGDPDTIENKDQIVFKVKSS